MPRYLIEEPIKHGGRIVKEGMIELEESVASPLVKSKTLTLINGQDDGNDTPSGNTKTTFDNRTDEDIKLDKLVELIRNLNLQDKDVMTKSGKPDANVLSEMLHDNVSAQERDVAWSEFQAKQAEQADNPGAE